MRIERRQIWKGAITAHLALVGPVVAMEAHVAIQVRLLPEAHVADGADIVLFARVHAQVLGVVVALVELLATRLARERVAALVVQHVDVEVRLVAERLAAQVAHERHLTCRMR